MRNKFILGIIIASIFISILIVFSVNTNEVDFNYRSSKDISPVYQFEKERESTITGTGIGIGANGKPTGIKNGKFPDVKTEIFCRFKYAGFSDAATAGIMGNIEAESGFTPDMVERKKSEPKGYGLMQLTDESTQTRNGARGTFVREYVAKSGAKYPSVESQIEFHISEMSANNWKGNSDTDMASFNTHKKARRYNLGNLYDPNVKTWADFKNIKDPVLAAGIIMWAYERCAEEDRWSHWSSRRMPNAKKFYAEFKGKEQQLCYSGGTDEGLTSQTLTGINQSGNSKLDTSTIPSGPIAGKIDGTNPPAQSMQSSAIIPKAQRTKPLVAIDIGHGQIKTAPIGATYKMSTGQVVREIDQTFRACTALHDNLISSGKYDAAYVSYSVPRVSLSKLVEISNNMDADIYISCHFNDSSGTGGTGVEVLYKKNNESAALGRAIAKNLSSEFGLALRGNNGLNPRADVTVISNKNNAKYTVLIEGGFIDKEDKDLKIILKDDYPERYAKSVIRALDEVVRR